MLKKLVKKIPLTAIPLILCALALCVMIFLIRFRVNAASTGGLIGGGTGTLVGRAVGSLEGLSVGQAEGFHAGKEQGLKAEDTTAELAGKIKEAGRLQVLVASGTYTDVLTVGTKGDYAAILSQRYNAVFTVEPETAEIVATEDGLRITLDPPEVEFRPVGKYEILNEYQKYGFTGDANSGHQAAINSANQIKEKATAMLAEDEDMQEAARAGAEEQLIGLVRAVSLSKPKVTIEWRAER